MVLYLFHFMIGLGLREFYLMKVCLNTIGVLDFIYYDVQLITYNLNRIDFILSTLLDTLLYLPHYL